MPHLTVAQLAEFCDGHAEGDDQLLITGVNALETATETDLSFVANQKAARAAHSSHAGCLLVPLSFERAGHRALIRVQDPRTAFATAVYALCPPKHPPLSVHPTANIASSANIAPDCFIGAYVTVGENTSVGSGCVLHNGCILGARVTIGEHTVLYPNVTVYENVRIGSRVIIHSGAVLGADGFGFTFAGDRYEKFPQIGTVEIGDDVEIGANSCIDRAALGTTQIGDGVKLDNLVHVAHNCKIGKHVVVAAQTGFSGGVIVGEYAVIGGQAGIGEGAHIESRAVVGGKSGILPSQRVRSGEPVWGIPARPLRQHLQGLANLAKLPALREQFRQLKAKVDALASRPDSPNRGD